MKQNAFIIVLLVFSLSLSALTQLKVGYYDNPPKIYKDELTNTASGFWADITNKIGKDANIEIEWVFGTWNEGLERLNSGDIDVIFDVAETEARKEKMLFTQEAVMLSWSNLYTNNNTKINSLLDFKDKQIGVLLGSVNYKSIGGAVDLFKSFNIDVEFIEFDSYREILEDVSNGKIFAGVTSKDIGDMYFNNGLVNSTPFWFQPSSYKYAVSIKNPNAKRITSIIDTQVSKYKKDDNSVYYKALSKHFDTQRTIYFPQWAKLLLAFLLILIITIYLFNRILSAKVKSQTKHLTEEIKEREKAQHELKLSMKKLEELNKVKDNFLQSVSHELLTPLNSILGFSDVLFTSKDEITADIHDEYITKIHKSGSSLLKIVNNMIDATLINSNLMTLTCTEFNIYEQTTKIFNNYPKSEKLSYKMLISEDCDKSKTMTTDYDQLKKILIHLLDNATKFTEEGEIVCGYRIEDEKIIFFIKDSGIGIMEKDHKIIFEEFTKVDGRRKQLSEGAGLGLAIVSSLVYSLHGKISVESSLEEGSTFTIEFPLEITC